MTWGLNGAYLEVIPHELRRMGPVPAGPRRAVDVAPKPRQLSGQPPRLKGELGLQPARRLGPTDMETLEHRRPERFGPGPPGQWRRRRHPASDKGRAAAE